MDHLPLGEAPSLDDRSAEKLRNMLDGCVGRNCAASDGEDPGKVLPWGKLKKLPVFKRFSEAQGLALARAVFEECLVLDDARKWRWEKPVADGWTAALRSGFLTLAVLAPSSGRDARDGEGGTESRRAFELSDGVEVTLERPEPRHVYEARLREIEEELNRDTEDEADCQSREGLRAELEQLRRRRAWYATWLVELPVFRPFAVISGCASEVADWLTVLPDIAGKSSVLASFPSMYHVWTGDGSNEPRALEGTLCVEVAGDAGDLLEWGSRCGYFALLHDREGANLRAAVRLLAMGKRTAPDLRVVLELAALEALCGLNPDVQIQKRVKACVSILYPPRRRSSIHSVLNDMYRRRNAVVHGRLADGHRGRRTEVPEDSVASMLARWLRLACTCPGVSELTLTKTADHYLAHDGELAEMIRAACDADAPVEP